jgi:hypothetical protein
MPSQCRRPGSRLSGSSPGTGVSELRRPGAASVIWLTAVLNSRTAPLTSESSVYRRTARRYGAHAIDAVDGNPASRFMVDGNALSPFL